MKKHGIYSKLEKLFKIFIDPLLEFLNEGGKEILATSNSNRISSVTKILSCLMNNFKDTDYKIVPQEELVKLEESLEGLFLFATFWGLGGSLKDIHM